MSYEVELKFPLRDVSAVVHQLQELGATATGACDEADTYFDHPSRSFEHSDEALRVRQSDSKIVFTYKGPKVDAATKTRLEIELELAASCTASDAQHFWESLGFRRCGTVRKHRRYFELEWQGRRVAASLDRVDPLGDFLELELSAEPAELDESRQVVTSLAARLGLRTSERRSYLELVLKKHATAADTAEKAEDWSE